MATAPHAEPAGSRIPRALAEKYELSRELRGEGRGQFYKVTHRYLHHFHVLKRLRPEHADDEGARERFLMEAQVAKKLVHPHIVRIHDFGVDDDGPYIVRDFVEGQTLRSVIDNRIRLKLSYLMELAGQILDALRYMHAQGYLHLGLTSEKIFIDLTDEKPRAIITDLSTVRPAHGARPINTADPDERYGAPEQRGGRARLDGRADLYAVGVILYELLTFENPVVRDGGKRQDPVLWGRGDSGAELRLSPDIRELLSHALPPDPDRRYDDAEAFLQAVSELRMANTGPIPKTVPSPETYGRARRPFPWHLVVAFVSIVVLLAVFYIFLRQPDQDEGSPGKATEATEGELSGLPAPKDAGASKPYRK